MIATNRIPKLVFKSVTKGRWTAEITVDGTLYCFDAMETRVALMPPMWELTGNVLVPNAENPNGVECHIIHESTLHYLRDARAHAIEVYTEHVTASRNKLQKGDR